MDSVLQTLLEELKQLRGDIKSLTTPQVARKTIREWSRDLGLRWHREVSPRLKAVNGISPDVIKRYDEAFTRLIRLSAPNNLKASYLETLGTLIPCFRDELLIPVQQGILSGPEPSAFDSFFSSLPNPEESEYLREAISCARSGYHRAAVVLGWSAAIDRVHRKIQAVGFAQFNIASASLASQKTGRFKKFNQVQNIASLSELREVFDTIILWIIEGMGLIDSNQHTRLRSCFEMRCQSAHPGDAPITEYNLLSFFSDLDQIVLSNPKFVM